MALPEIKDKKEAIALSNQNKIRSKESFFDKLMLNNLGKSNIEQGRSNLENFLAKQDNDVEERRIIRRISNNTDEIVLLLRAMKEQNDKNKNDKFDWKTLIPLIPFIGGLAFPELTKGLITALKSADFIKNGAKALESASTVSKTVSTTAKAADAVGDVSKAAKFGGKALGALGKFSDNKYVSGAVRFGSLGAIGANLFEQDYLGAGLEAASLASYEASRKTKNPKLKALLTGASLATDGLIVAKDFIGGESGLGTAIGAGALATAAGAGIYANRKRKAGSISKAEPSIVINNATPSKINSITPLQGAGNIVRASPNLPSGASVGPLRPTNIMTNGFAMAGAKGAAKFIPGVGLAMGAAGAYSRVSKGDYIGAAGEAVAGLASLIPGIGTVASLAITAGLSYRDSQKANAEQLKLSIGTMQRATATNEAQIKSSNDLIRKTTSAMGENSKGVKLSIGTLAKTLTGFTGLFGASLIGWLTDSHNIFKNVFITLTSISGKIGGYLKQKWDQFTGNDYGSTNGYSGKIDNSKLRTKIGKGDISGERLGTVSKLFETSGAGVSTVSSGKGDHGGVSYGAHQMTATTMTDFLKSKEGSAYKNQFAGLKPGTAAFSSKYKEIASKDGTNFGNAQKAYIDKKYYGVAHEDIRKKTGLVVNNRGRALQELVYSTAVQYGPYSIGKWLNSLYGKEAVNMSDAAIITAIQNYKIKNNDSLMKSSSTSVRKGVANRAQTEKEILLNINAKNKGTSGKDNLTKGNKVKNPSAQFTTASDGTATRKIQDKANQIVKNATMTKTPGIGVLKPGVDPSVAKTSSSAATVGAGVLKDTNASKATTQSNKSESDNKAKSADWNLDKVVSYAVAKAKGRKATGDCAKYVRMALQAGDTKGKVPGGLGHANNYINSLPKIGWVSVGQNVTSWKKGDISVFMQTGTEAGKKYGHVAIWTGSVWVSDHIQKSIQPNVSLGNYPYSIWRAKSGYTNGAAVGADVITEDVKTGADGLSAASDSVATSEDAVKSPFETAVDAVTSGIANLGAMFGNSETVKNALDWVNSAQVDEPFQRIVDSADLTGFNMNFPSQGEYSYKFGEGGDFKESELYSRNDIRQQKGQDILGQAGSIPGIVRQQKGQDILGKAGAIPGIVRQQPGYDVLGQAGSLGGIIRQGGSNKKLKWWEKLFGGENSDIFKMLADTFGLSGVYDFGKTISEAHKTGDWVGAAEKTIIPMLSPNIAEKEKVDGYISNLNKEYRNPTTPPTNIKSIGAENMPNISLGKGGKGGNIDGMSSSIVTRNPDSIFREVSIAMMKASTT